MKPYIVIIYLCLSFGFRASAQDYKVRKTSALIVVTHKEEYLTDTIGIRLLKEQGILKRDDIGDININPGDISKYGANAANGIIRFIIDDKKYPKAYYHIVKTMNHIGPAEKQNH